MRQALTIVLITVAVCASAFAGGTVTLKGASRVLAGETLTLRDIARLDGDAAALRDVPVAFGDAERGVVKLNIEDVRRALREAGVELARFAINGSECSVRILPSKPEKRVAEPSIIKAVWSPSTDERSFHARIMRMIAEYSGLAVDSVRATWQGRDHEFLDRTDENVRLVVEPITSEHSARAAILVRVWREDAIVQTRTLRAEIRLKRTTCVSTREIRRGEIITESDLQIVHGFERPDRNGLIAETAQAVGQIAKKTISKGVALEQRHLEPAVLVERGRPVTLYCMHGSVEIRTVVRAKEDGVLGQLIEVKKNNSRSTIFARVAGPSRVVVDGAADH